MHIYNKDKPRESKLIEHIRLQNIGHHWSVLIGSVESSSHNLAPNQRDARCLSYIMTHSKTNKTALNSLLAHSSEHTLQHCRNKKCVRPAWAESTGARRDADKSSNYSHKTVNTFRRGPVSFENKPNVSVRLKGTVIWFFSSFAAATSSVHWQRP